MGNLYRNALVIACWLTAFQGFAQQISISADVRKGCGPLVVNLSSNAPANSTFFWEFDNGNSSTLANPSTIYYKEGFYTIKLTVTPPSGSQQIITETDFITVFKKPEADFIIGASEGCIPFRAVVIDKSIKGSGNLVKWKWDLGHGFSGMGSTDTIIISRSGTYHGTLVVTDTNNCLHTITKNNLFTVFENPKADFSATPSLACDPPASFAMTNLSQLVSGTTAAYTWHFGNGDQSNNTNTFVTIDSNGKYWVSLTVTDSRGCRDSLYKKDYLTIGKPKADFFLASSICAGDVVQIYDRTTQKVAGMTYLWEFPDNTTSTDVNPVYQFSQSGTFSLKLTVTTPEGCKSSKEINNISVNPQPSAQFTASDSLSCSLPHGFTLLAVEQNATLNWHIHDSAKNVNMVRTGNNVFINLNKYDEYTVELSVTGTNGCTNYLKKFEYIKAEPTRAVLSLDRDRGCAPYDVQFWGSYTGLFPIKKWQWDFGDGAGSNLQNPVHTFKDTGIFKVVLFIEDEKGCTDTASYIVKAGAKPAKPDFISDKDSGCIQDMLTQFTNLTPFTPLDPDSFYWDFDGMARIDKDPLLVLDNDSGWHSVTLYAAHYGCVSSETKYNFYYLYPAKPVIEIIHSKCDPDSIRITNKTKGGHIFHWVVYKGIIKDPRYIVLDTFSRDIHRRLPFGFFTVSLTVTDTIHGCVNTKEETVQIPEPFDANFINDPQVCAPATVFFENKSTAHDSCLWELSDGRTSKDNNATFLFEEPGKYNMKLTIYKMGGECIRTIEKKDVLKVFGLSVFPSVTGLVGCAPHTVSMKDSISSAFGVSYKWWDMGNGDSIPATGTNLSYTYNAAPPNQVAGYPLSLKVLDENNCITTKVFKVKVLKPVPVISKRLLPSCAYPEYLFAASQSPAHGLPPLSFQWQVDGIPSTGSEVRKLFDKEGSFPVKLNLTDSFGCKAEESIGMDIKHAQLTVDFTSDVTSAGCPPMPVEFIALVEQAYSPIIRYEWDFGDNTFSTLRDPGKIYLVPGVYDVKLRVIDSFGCNKQELKIKYIRLGGPIGSFTAVPYEGCVPLTVHFESSTIDADSIVWDLGDGSLGYGPKLTYTYKRVGSYIPSMVLSDEAGCTFAYPTEDPILVRPLPEANFQDIPACSGEKTKFINLSDNGNLSALKSVYWDFGDGTTSDLVSPEHIYTLPGNYDVKLVVENIYGCRDTLTKNIFIHGITAHLTGDNGFGCLGVPLNFTGSFTTYNTNAISSFWNFGDGNTSSVFGGNITHTYEKTGIYQVSYTVFTQEGCEDTYVLDKFMIGDTVGPDAPILYAVSVLNDFEVQIKYSKHMDYDFGAYLLYESLPGGGDKLIKTIEDVNETAVTAEVANTRFSVYRFFVRKSNLCGFMSHQDSSEIHATIELYAKPDTNRNLLEWTAYEGWDAVNTYLLEKEDESGVFQPLAVLPGNVYMYSDTDVVCNRAKNYRIFAEEAGGYSQSSYSDTSKATAFYKTDISGNEMVRVSVEGGKDNVVIDWEMPPYYRSPITEIALERNEENGAFKPIKEAKITDLTANNRASVNLKPYYYRIKLKDSCGVYGPYSPVHKTIHLRVDTNDLEKPVLHWTNYLGWESKVSKYEIYRLESDHRFHYLGEVSGNDSSFTDALVPYNGRRNYCYKVKAYQTADYSVYSWSNEACAPMRPRLYVPNAFTPNGDGINPGFLTNGVFLYRYHIEIFSRWGELLYVSDSLEETWDGMYKEQACQQDVYIYYIRAEGSDYSIITRKGNITLLR